MLGIGWNLGRCGQVCMWLVSTETYSCPKCGQIWSLTVSHRFYGQSFNESFWNGNFLELPERDITAESQLCKSLSAVQLSLEQLVVVQFSSLNQKSLRCKIVYTRYFISVLEYLFLKFLVYYAAIVWEIFFIHPLIFHYFWKYWVGLRSVLFDFNLHESWSQNEIFMSGHSLSSPICSVTFVKI